MEASFSSKLKHAWNAFREEERNSPRTNGSYDLGNLSTVRLDRRRLYPSSERSIVASVYSRIAIDVSAISIKHIRVDSNDVFKETLDSGLNDCLTRSANIDQTPQEFFIDAVMSMFEEGHVVLVPVETTTDRTKPGEWQIKSIRTGRVTQWYPRHVRVEAYNELTGLREEVTLPKELVCIVENPLYSVMNERNSTLQRLIRKISLLDSIDEQNSISKLDLIIQLPYVVKSEARKQQALARRKEIEEQMTNSKLGIAYTDGTEKITQLNRSVENNLPKEVSELTMQLYNQLGLTPSVFDGTADEATMLNYNNRTVKPILEAFVSEMTRKWITKTAYSQGQRVEYFSDPFGLVPVSQLAEIADKLTRNEVLAPNEMRSKIGFKPSDDPRANELRNRNLNVSDEQMANPVLVDEENNS